MISLPIGLSPSGLTYAKHIPKHKIKIKTTSICNHYFELLSLQVLNTTTKLDGMEPTLYDMAFAYLVHLL